MNLALRAARPADRPFVETVYFETQRWIIEKLFGWRGDDFERERFLSHYHEGETSVVTVDGHDAGWMCVRQEPGALHIHSIYLLPSFQGRGIGTALIRNVLDDASARSLGVTIDAAKINPARKLYERLGFVATHETEFKVFMEYGSPHGMEFSGSTDISSTKPGLRPPCLELADSFVRMRDAFRAAGEDEWTGRHALAHTDVPAWIAALQRRARGEEIPEDWMPWVPETQYWVVLDGEVVGDLELRHPLNEHLSQVGGNIGYGTHPLHRRRGIATFALREGLRILGEWGVTEALATCRDDNIASIRTIENAGGRRIEDADYRGPKRRRYLIPTAERVR